MTNIGYTPEEPIAAIATALAPGAIGIVRTTGNNCINLISEVFSRPNAIKNARANTLIYGWMQEKNTKIRIDEVMVGIYKAPKSFTGEDMVEIYCHGGVSVVTAVLSLLLKNGFRQAERGEFTFRAYINGKTDLTKAEAVKEIIDSKTDISRGRAAGRLAGNLFTEIDNIKKLIVDTLAAIEVEIEYPEDEETIADSFDASQLKTAQERLFSLVKSWKSEKLYQDGARVILCGKTNAGKSSLFNALLKEERAIVSDIEGTTRDWLESWVSFEGIPVRLFDTAGLRSTTDTIEAEGVERTRDLTADADIILYLVDSYIGLTVDDINFISSNKKTPIILVWNKSDKSQENSSATVPDESYKKDIRAEIKLSAKKGNGIGSLISTAKNILCGGQESDRDAAGLGSQRQRDSVQEALERIQHALFIAQDGSLGLDAVVQDLEDSLDSLGEVTGEVTPDDVLGSVFANFCV
nr:tRNA uridine-5-carboxymethylaminomethyl(34) synthesis GTPase MnmE [Treponema sp.]